MLNEIDLARVDLNLLVLFQRVLHARHVGRAAGQMNLSASAVSHGLGRLRRLLNDPLFLRTPKGVVPTALALEIAPATEEILARVSTLLRASAPFDPRVASRRFTIGAPDGVSAVLVKPLLAALAARAPGIDLSLRHLLPATRDSAPEPAWHATLTELDSRTLDIAIVPVDEVPARFHARTLYEEDFVIVARPANRFAITPSLAHYCEARHVVVTGSGDPHGFVDDALAQRQRSRRVCATAPTFFLAMAIASDADLAVAVPRRFGEAFGHAFGLVVRKAPLPLPRFTLKAVMPEAGLQDAGLAWLLALLESTQRHGRPQKNSRRRG